MMVSGDQWPIFIYQGYSYNVDDPWNGLFRSAILISVSYHFGFSWVLVDSLITSKAYKFVFTSPSSVEKEPKATRSGNARIHSMTRVTPASIAYIATQVWTFTTLMHYPGYWCLSGSVCTEFLPSVFLDWYGYRFQAILQQCDGFIWWRRRERRSRWLAGVVEPVRLHYELDSTASDNILQAKSSPIALPSAMFPKQCIGSD